MILSPFSIYKVTGNSMLPTLKPGDKVLAFTWLNSYRVGDLVVFKTSRKEIIKRIELVKGQELFLKGDNEGESTDSRNFGWVDKSLISGKVIYIIKS